MRTAVFILAFLLGAVLFGAAAHAQVAGEVESLGFNGYYRPDCWTPVVVTLKPLTGKTDNFLLRIRQDDMDRDHPIFTRVASLTGATPEHPAPQQRFRTYFLPQPTGGGLIDPGQPTRNPNLTPQQELDEELPVELWSTSMKLVTGLPLTSNLISVDGNPTGFDERTGRRMVLAVHSAEEPPQREYDATTGLLERVQFVSVRVGDLPECSTGYDAVDAVLWLDADPAELRLGGDEKLHALEQFVRSGGHLVVCQSPQWQKTAVFGDLLPVTLTGTRTRDDAEPLRSIAAHGLRLSTLWTPEALEDKSPGGAAASLPPSAAHGMPEHHNTGDKWLESKPDDKSISAWFAYSGPFTVGVAEPRPGSFVESWMPWRGEMPTPYIARRVVGAGAVTWVAQDLASDELRPRGAPALCGWPFIWQAVFDWKDTTRVIHEGSNAERAMDHEYGPSSDCDEFGSAMLGGMELPGRSAALIGVAFAFFVGYWVLAGPGGYGFLVTKRRTHMSWFAFGATALAGTLVTVLIVRFMLSGPPEMRHISVVRIAPGQPAVVRSRFGLYIPQDGNQRIELESPAPRWSATLSAFAAHPQLKTDFPDDNGPEYDVPVQDEPTDGPIVLNVPFRSTLKRFQASWAGDLSQRIEGVVSLNGRSVVPVSGKLTNKTDRTLTDVFIAVKGMPRSDPQDVGEPTNDHLLYLPAWNAGQTIDLQELFRLKLTGADEKATGTHTVGIDGLRPGQGADCLGQIAQDWQPQWMRDLSGHLLSNETPMDDPLVAVPVLTFFSRVPPMHGDRESGARREFRRLGERHMDLSPAIGAGAVVIVASVRDDPIPIPLKINGQATPGTGLTIYQFVLPADTTAAATPSTQPAMAPSRAEPGSASR